MATTITSYPSALSLAGNIAPVRVAASDTFRFKLSKGSSVLLEEDYTPDASGYAEIDIRDIVLSDLYLSLPSSDVFCQSAAAASYTISAGVDSKTFTGVLCGVDRPATDAATFLLANFLTWQPQIKAVQYNQPEWLSFFVSSAQTSLKVRFYKKDGTTADVVVADSRSFDPNRVYSVNMQFARIWALGDGDRYGMFDAWLEDDQGTKLTYTQRYVLDTSSDDRTLFVTRNSLGGLDTFVLHGSVELASEAEHTNVMRARLLAAGTIDGSRTYSVNTGLLSLHEAKWMQDLLRSQQSWVLLDGALRSIVLLSPSVTSSSIDDSSGTVDFMLCDDDGYLNIARTDVAPEAIEVPGPDGGEVFFLAPRLIEYPDASLEDSWLIPLQSGFEEKWYKASLGGIRSYVAGYLEDTYGRLWHGHDNLAVLDKFGIDASGALTWNGNPVGSGTNAGDFVTLATEQTITGKKTFSADAVFATKLYVPSTAGAGVYDVFIDDNGAVSGETPSAGGEGLDIDAMWSELAADDASRAIHLSHIPLIPWGNVSGKPTTLQGYGLQTEADNRYVRLVDGMGLSSNDYTDGEKEKLSGIAAGAQVNVLESVKLNGSLLQVTSKAVNVNAVTSLSVPTGLSAGDMTSVGKISVSLASGYVIPKNTAKFWGRTWNGLADVSGAIEGATDIDASGTVYAATAIRTNKLYVPASSGNNVYDIFIDDSGTVSGEAPAAGEGLDIDAMWEELATDDASRVINLSHIPLIPWGNVSGIPSTFTPSAHSHKKSDISDFPTTWAWSAISGKPDTFTPSAHNQAWSTITDTPTTLAGYGITDAYNKTDADGRYVLKSTYTASDVLSKLLTVDGTGSKLDADLLDGTHKADLFSALSSNATTNLSVTVGGTIKSIADLYATYADKLRTARTLWGQSFDGTKNVSGDMTGVGNVTISGSISGFTELTSGYGSGNRYTRITNSGFILVPSRGYAGGLSVRKSENAETLGQIAGVNVSDAISYMYYGGTSYLSPAMVLRPYDSDWRMGIGTTSPSYKLDVAGTGRFTSNLTVGGTMQAAVVVSNKLYVPASAGNQVYDLYIDDTGTVSGEAPAAGEGGIDIDAMWNELATDDASRVIDLSHIPMIPWGNVSGIPSAFTPSAHTHTKSQITDFPTTWAWSAISGKPTTFTPSAHNQAWSTITDTPTTLAGYGITDAYNKTDADERYLLKSAYTASDVLAKLLTVDGTGSKLDADLLDGTHKADLFSALSSNATTNLSVTIGGTTKSIADLYATYADKLRTARTLWGQSFDGTKNVSGDMTGVGNVTISGSISGFTELTSGYGSDNRYTRITNSGFILVPSRGYAGGLSVRKSENAETLGQIAGVYVQSDAISYMYYGGTSYLSPAMVLRPYDSDWRMGIGTTSPSYKLDVAGTFRATGTAVVKTLTISSTASEAHLAFGRSAGWNYITTSDESSTIAFAIGGTTNGAGSTLTIAKTSVIPGYNNNAINLGTSSYRWANVYSVLGNFSGLVTASSGVQIGSTSDYGWYLSNSRLAAGMGVARGVNAGSLLISSAWADYTKVPTNGLYCKGDIWTGGKLYIPSTSGNNVYDIYLDENGIVSGETPGTDTLDKITDLDPSWQPVLQEEPALLFAGRVSSTGTVTKYAGTGTLACSRSATGIYALTLKDDSQNTVSLYSCCVTATALYTSSTSAAYICTTNYVSSVYSVKISNLASGALANCAFNIVIFK